MQTFVALLQSVVLEGGRRFPMADLRAMAEGMGFDEVRTLAATGNLVFNAAPRHREQLDAELGAAFAQSFGKPIPIITRTAAAWRRLAAANPFSEQAAERPASVVVRVMRDPYPLETLDALRPYCSGERIALVAGDLWIAFPGPQSHSRLTGAFTTRRFSAVGTLRNWNTVRRIDEMLSENGIAPPT